MPAGLLGLSLRAIRRAGDFKKTPAVGETRYEVAVGIAGFDQRRSYFDDISDYAGMGSRPGRGNQRAQGQQSSGHQNRSPPGAKASARTNRDRGGESSRNRSVVQRTTPPPQHVTVNAPTPLPGPSQVSPEKAFDADKVPGTITTIDTSQIARTNSLNITDSLQQYVPGVSVSTVAGNEFAPNVDFRGYVSSPVSGTPQGLAVYQNGVRINEAFGDTMNWDLIPTAAIRSVTLVTNNPAYGLNALGGALNIQMKNGFNYHGAEIDVMGGSYGRIQTSLQWGKQINEWAIYGAFEAIHDDGYRLFSESNILRFYGDIGHRNMDSEIHLNMGAASNNYGAAGTSPAELLQTAWNADYTTPQTNSNQVGYLNLTGRFDVSPTWTIDANAHYRAFSQHTQDGNPSANGVAPCAADATLLCNRTARLPTA